MRRIKNIILHAAMMTNGNFWSAASICCQETSWMELKLCFWVSFLFYVLSCPVDTSSRRRGTWKTGELSDKNMKYYNRKSLFHFHLVYYLTHRRSLSSSWTVSHYYFILVRIHTCRCARQLSYFALVRLKVKSGGNSTLTDDEFLG